MEQRRYSHQREIILRCLRGQKTHPTADMIYQQLKPDHPKLSLWHGIPQFESACGLGEITRCPSMGALRRGYFTPCPFLL